MRTGNSRGARSRAWSAFLRVATCLALVAMSVQMAPPAAAATKAPSAQPSAPAAAKSGGGQPYKPAAAKPTPTEITSRRTTYSDTYDNHDGTYTTRITAAPQNYKPSAGAAYQPIDLSFAAISGGNGRVRAAHTIMPVEVGSPDDASGFLSVDTGSGVIRLRLAPGTKAGIAGSKPAPNGGSANVTGLTSTMDLDVAARADGARAYFVLKSAPSSSSFSLALDAGGLKTVLNPDDTISFLNAKGALVAFMPQPYAVDSTVDARTGSGRMTDQVSYSLSTQGASTILSVNVDPSWLASATYPVYVDPTISGTANTTDNFVSAEYPTYKYPSYQNPDNGYWELWLGTSPDGTTDYNNDYIEFNLSTLAGTTIQSANLEVYPWWQYEHYSATTTWVDLTKAAWNTSTLTWNNQPGFSTSITSAGLTQGDMGSFNVTSTVQNWVASPSTNYGFELTENTEPDTYWKRLISSEEGGADIPALVVTFMPPVASNLSPSGGAWTNSRTLSWSYTDGSAHVQADYAIEVATNSAFTSPIVNTGTVAGAAISYSIPSGTTLTDGTTYYWEVEVNNGTSWSAWASASFRWDATPPVWNAFTAPTAKLDRSASSYTFGWSAITTDTSGINHYEVVPQSVAISGSNTCGSSWTNMTGNQSTSATSFALTSMATATCYRAAVRAQDNAGNYSGYSYSSPILVDTSAPAAPVVTDNCTSVGSCYRVGNTIYFRPAAAATVTLTSTGTDNDSGIGSSTFGSLSPSTGWTYTSGTVSGNPAVKSLTWSGSAVSATLAVTTTNNAGLISAATTITFTADPNPPVGSFTAPAGGALVMQSGTGYTVSWNETDTGSGVASRSLQRQKGAVVTAGTCSGVSWTADGSPTTSASPLSVTGLATGNCYQWLLTLTDNVGNWNQVPYTSGSLLVDTATPSMPNVALSPASGVYQPGSNGTAYFRPAAGGSMTLTATPATTPPSGVACINFGNLTPSTGWTPTPSLPNCDATSPYSQSLAFGSSTGSASIDVKVQNGAGTWSATRTISLTPDTGASMAADFTTPNEATQIDVTSAAYTVAWTEADPGSGVASRSLQRQRRAASGGSCTGSWQNDGSPTTAASPAGVTLADGYCYQWVLTLTDNVGNAKSFTSGSVLVDMTAPTGSITYPQAGLPIDGTLAVTGTASDLNFSGYVLAYGAGSSPASWSTIATSASPISSGTLGTWATGSLTGVYTLRLTVTDAAGNTTVATHTLYLDNTDRGDEPYYTSVPFDLGGGWNLGVNVATGEATLSRGLFSIPSWGPSQSLSLAYNSADPSAAGLFGTGWSSNLTQYLDLSNLSAGFVVWHQADGGRVPFGLVSGTTWTALAGHYETLTQPGGGGYKITDTDQSSYSFDGTGKLTAVTDRYGNALTLNWNAGSGIATATDAGGHATTIAISGSGPISSVTDSAGRAWSFGYSGSGYLLTSLTDPAGNVTTLAYDASNRLTSISRPLTPYGGSPAPVAWTVGYDASSGKVTSVTDPVGGSANKSTFAYGAGYASGTTTVVRPRDTTGITPPTTTLYTLDALGRGWVSSTQEYATAVNDADPVSWITNFVYDPNGNVTSQIHQIDWDGDYATTTWTYEPWGDVATETDPLGITTTNTYETNDAFHDLTSKVVSASASGQTLSQETAYAYDSAHHPCREVANPTVNPSTITCTSTLPSGAADQNVDTRYAYDARNQMVSQTDPLGIVTAYAYDAWGDQTSVTKNYMSGVTADDSTNVMTTYSYDAAGDVLSETKPISTTPPVSATTSYTYDLLGNGLTETDPGDSSIPETRTVSTYDQFGDKTSATSQVCAQNGSGCTWSTSSATSTIYDALGHTTSVTDTTAEPGGSEAVATTTYLPDLAGDVIFAVTPDGVGTVDTYDALGETTSESAKGATTVYWYDGLGREVETEAPGSDTGTLITVSTFDADGNLLVQEADSSDGSVSTTTNEYDLLGRMIQTTDPAGQVTSKSYDAIGRVIHSVTGAAASDTTYDRDGNAIEVVGPYDSTDQDAVKTTTDTAYDALGRECRVVDDVAADLDLATMSDPCTAPISGTATTNITTTTYYDAAGDVVASVDDDGLATESVTRTFYNIDGDVTETIENCTDSGQDPPADPTACTGAGTSDFSTNVVTTNTYGASGGLLLSEKTVAGVKTDTTYDGAGNVLTSVVDAGGLNLTTSYAYDDSGHQISETDPDGVVTDTVYDANGRVCRTIENATIDPSSLANPCTDPIAAKTATTDVDTMYSYDDAGNKTDETDPDGTVTYDVYDGAGNVTSEITDYVPAYSGTDPGVNATTSYTYDDSGRQITSSDPAGVVTATVYDEDGNVCRTIDDATIDPTTLTNPCTDPIADQTANANIDTRYSYDAAGNKTQMVAPSPADGGTPTSTVTTDYVYDANERLCRVVENADPNLDLTAADGCTIAITSSAIANVDTQYTYDADGNLASQYSSGDPSVDDLAGTTYYAFDDLAHQLSQTDADGNTTSWTYDVAGNKASETDPDGQKTYWFYDAAGRLCRRVAVAANATYQLPSAPCTTTTGVTGAAVDTIYTYDADGNQTSATDALSHQAITATYDALARPTQVTDTGGATTDPGTTYTYSLSNPTRTDPSGSYTFTLDAAGRQASLADPLHPSGNQYAWTYGATGAVASMTDPTGNKTSYSYDALGRLTGQSAGGSSACSACALYTYAYNAAGSQISTYASIYGGSANGTTAYTYDTMSRLLTYTPPSVAAKQTYTWNATPDRTSITKGSGSPVTTTYDAASRPVTDASDSSDKEGRITKLPGAHTGETLTLSWDPLGRLTGVTSSLGASSSSTYTYDPLDRLETITTNGVTTSFLSVGLTDALAQVTTGSSVTKYVSDLDGNELYDYDATTLAPIYLGRDGHDDVTWTSDSTGAVSSTATYDPFGNLASSTGSVPNTRWQGSWQDGATGLYNVVSRWYSPVLGSFLSDDPRTAPQTDPQARDPYAYGAGDSVDRTDPTGECSYYAGGSYGCADEPFLLATSVVSTFFEPYPNYKICGAGALRVVLAFVGIDPGLQYPDSHGQGYMLYLAYAVQPKGAKWHGVFGHLKNGAPTNFPGRIQAAANWEWSGWGQVSGSPFRWSTRHVTFSKFETNVETQLITKGVPVQVSLQTSASLQKGQSATADEGLPSWHTGSSKKNPCIELSKGKCVKWSSYHYVGHYVSIVGYDNESFYYVDTCQGDCNPWGPRWSSGWGLSYRPHVWRVGKDVMWDLMKVWDAGYLLYSGPPSNRGAGY